MVAETAALFLSLASIDRTLATRRPDPERPSGEVLTRLQSCFERDRIARL